MLKDLGGLMKQAKELQERMSGMQTALEATEITGTSGAGLVTVRLNGKGAMLGIDIDQSLLKADEGEILEDLVVAAHADARVRLERTVAEKMKEVTGGLPLPPGFSLGI
jgi:hypothetical protein